MSKDVGLSRAGVFRCCGRAATPRLVIDVLICPRCLGPPHFARRHPRPGQLLNSPRTGMPGAIYGGHLSERSTTTTIRRGSRMVHEALWKSCRAHGVPMPLPLLAAAHCRRCSSLASLQQRRSTSLSESSIRADIVGRKLFVDGFAHSTPAGSPRCRQAPTMQCLRAEVAIYEHS